MSGGTPTHSSRAASEAVREETDHSSFTRQMGVNHQDLFRRLPAAIGFLKYSIRGDTITIVDQQQQLLIRFGEVQERRVGALCLPTTRLDFTFSGFSNSAVVAFMERFDLYFRCGGG